MANYKGHLVGGLCAFGVTWYVVQLYCEPTALVSMEWFLFSLAGSLFPDIDTKSKGQHFFYWIMFGLLLYLTYMHKWRTAVYLSILSMVPLLVHHRGLFHNTLFNIMFPLVSAFIVGRYVPACNQRLIFDACFFIVGALSHLWLDLGIRRMLRL